MMLVSGQILVRKLRARVGAGYDRIGPPSRLGRTLESLDLSAGLPREAILCVRRFKDPLPGRLKPDGAPPPVAWREAVSESLRTLAPRAARPARELVGANENAVLFADHAELLACLARDWSCGEAPSQWWWRLLFPGLDLRNALVKAWLENPQHVPTALRRLDKVDCATGFLMAIPRSFVVLLRERVLDLFGLAALRREMVTERRSWATFTETPSAGARDGAPQLRWVKVDPLLPVESRQLLVIALMLERAPGVLRSPQFIREWRAWDSRMDETSAEADPSSSGLNIGQPGAIEADSIEPTTEGTAAAPKFAGTAESASARTARTRDVVGPHSVSVQFQGPGADAPTNRSRLLRPSAATQAAAGFSPAALSTDPLVALPEPEREVVSTEWGGVFYLINVALAFGLYGDFTKPRQAGLAMPVWDFLTLLGQRLAGGESLADPLWPLLARLSGRSNDEPPGLGFEPPAEWRMPAEWLAGFDPGGVWRRSTAGDRLRLRHPLGFCLLDVPLGYEAPAARLEDELRYFAAGFKPVLREDDQRTPDRITDPLEQWLAWLIPCFHARLAAALGVTDARALHTMAFRQRANVEVTADCVAVRFRLAEHPIELRMAGLDRDPGWIRAAGRRIAFYYD